MYAVRSFAPIRNPLLLAGVAAFLWLLALAMPAVAQEETGAASEEEAEALATTGQQVGVTAVADEEIAARLRQILETTGRVEDLGVRVENGVVFLSGRTSRDEYRQWARDLALRTEDVVAVVNNLEVVRAAEPIWDFAPAMEELRRLWRTGIQRLPLIVFALVILLVTLIAARAVQRVSQPVLRRRIENPMLRGVVGNVLVFVVIVIGLYIVLRVAGLSRLAVTMIGGTGLIGLVIGFAFRDIAENFLASLLISVQKPFRIGDTIEVAGYTGLVQKVTTRGTVLMAYDGNYIQIANATVYKSTIRNFTINPKTRLDFVVGIGYDANVTEAQALLLGVVQRHPAVYDDPEPRVFVENLGASSIELHVYFWINIVEFSQFKVRSSVIRQSVAELLKAGVSMPDDNREMIFPEGVPVRMLGEEEVRREAAEEAEEKARKRVAAEEAPAVTEAEGNLVSEVDELQAQADEAGLPEAGRDILAEDGGEAGQGGGAA